MDKYIIVPWDFTENSENALLHAIQLSKVADAKILLLHIINKGIFSKNKELIERSLIVEKNLKGVAKEIFKKHKIMPETIITIDNLSKAIKQIELSINASMIVMGPNYFENNKTHKINSFFSALKNIETPFVTVKTRPSHDYYKEIVFPLDSDKKFKETLHWIIFLSKHFKCNVNIIKPYITDQFKKQDMVNNIYFTKKILDKKNIIYGIKTAKRNKSFKEEMFRFASDIDADLVVMMSKKFNDYVLHNKKDTGKTPVMSINRRSDLIKYSGFS
ncbi:MAG: universal stress protein [Bacteroidales bacterium]|nr:universal stress protein [Bacteroidales bacterium]